MAAAFVALAAPAAAQGAPHVPGEVVVRYAPGAGADARHQARASVDADVERRLALPRTELLEVEGPVIAAARALERRDDVLYAHPNYIFQLSATPNDPRFGELYGMGRISAPAAWDITTGSDAVTVAVLDSGVDMDHPDLAANIWRNPGESGGGKESNGVDDDGNGFVDDWRGWDFTDDDNSPHDGYAAHGTHVAGTIGARGNNGIGITGVSWNVKLMPLRIGKDDLSVDMAAGIDATDYAARNGAQIVNMSYGADIPRSMPAPLAVLDSIKRHPAMLFVIAAGNSSNDNDGDTASYPCNFSSEPNAICVAATDRNDALADYSNFGPGNVQLAAPGSTILSTQPLGQIHDDFDTEVPGRWRRFDTLWGNIFPVAPSAWARTTEEQRSGTHSYTDTPDALMDPGELHNSGIEFTTFLSSQYDVAEAGGTNECFVEFWWLPKPDRNPLLDPSAQSLIIETADPTFFGGQFWLDGATLNMASFPEQWQKFRAPLNPLHLLKDRLKLRFRLQAAFFAEADGVYIDDVVFWCGAPIPPEYKELDGTSMAAPHVAGAAALLKAHRPAATAAEVKEALLGSVDPLPSLAGKVATGGRLNAHQALTYTGPPPGGDDAPPEADDGTSAKCKQATRALKKAKKRAKRAKKQVKGAKQALRKSGTAKAEKKLKRAKKKLKKAKKKLKRAKKRRKAACR